MRTYVYVVRDELHEWRPVRAFSPGSEVEVHACHAVELQGPAAVQKLEEPLRPEPLKEIWVCVVTDHPVRMIDPLPL